MFDPVKPLETFVEGKISDVKTWVGDEEKKLGLDIQIAVFSKLAEFVENEVAKLKTERAKF